MTDSSEVLLQQVLVKLDEFKTDIRKDLNELKTQQKVLEEKINGIGKRLSKVTR